MALPLASPSPSVWVRRRALGLRGRFHCTHITSFNPSRAQRVPSHKTETRQESRRIARKAAVRCTKPHPGAETRGACAPGTATRRTTHTAPPPPIRASRRARSAPVQCRRITHSPETFSYLTCTTLTCPSSAGGALPSPRQSQRSDHMHRKGIVQKRPAERVQSRPHENARHKRRRACAPRLAQVPCHWSHGPGTRTNCNATRRHRSRANARRARGTCRRFARTARMGSGRRRPSGAGPCGQSASEPSRSSTASCRRRDPGLYPSSLPHCTYTTNSATPRRRKSAGGHRGPGCCQKSCRNYHIGRSEGIRWQSDGNQRSSEGDRRAMAIRWQSDGNQRSSEDDRRASDGNQLQSARPLLEPPKPGMLSKGLGAPFAHVQPLLVLWGRPSVPSTETRGAGRAQSTRTIRT